MGCTSSKHLPKEALRESRSVPLPRSVSMPVYHRAEREGDSNHMVALTSSSYGILKVDSSGPNHGSFIGLCRHIDDRRDVSSWAGRQAIVNVKLRPVKEEDECKTGTDSELETINSWELMKGLEDGLDLSPMKKVISSAMSFEPGKRRSLGKSMSFHTLDEVDAQCVRIGSPIDSIRSKYHTPDGKENLKPDHDASAGATHSILTELTSISTSSTEKMTAPPSCHIEENFKTNLSFKGDTEQLFASPLRNGISGDSCRRSSSPLFDHPAIVATFEKALDFVLEDDWQTKSQSTTSSSSLENATCFSDSSSDADSPRSERSCAWITRDNTLFDVVSEEKVDKFHGKKLSFSKISPLDFEEDWKVERSLDSFELQCPPAGEGKVVLYSTSLRGIRKTYEDCCELRLILQGTRVHVDERDVWMHSKFKQELSDLFEKVIATPRLFIKGRYIGAAEEVKQLHEEGILTKLLEGLPTEQSRQVCDGCGDIRFVPCLTCSGSCKLINDDNMVLRCPDCNENGLIMCPLCS